MQIEEVTAVLGRRPNDDELTFIKSVMGSKRNQYPFPALDSIIVGDGHGSVENGQLSIGLEGKRNIIKTKAKMQCAAQGGKGQLKISFQNAKFLVCDKINSENRKPLSGDNLIYLKAAADAEDDETSTTGATAGEETTGTTGTTTCPVDFDCSSHLNDLHENPSSVICASSTCSETECCTSAPAPSNTPFVKAASPSVL